MPPGIAQEVVNAAFGAYRLARFDPSGLDWFDLSVRGSGEVSSPPSR
jgi:hypothetical protein